MPAKQSLVGKTFGKWKVIADAPSKMQPSGTSYTYSLCQCDCGIKKTIQNKNLRNGRTLCCRKCSKLNRVHFMSHTRTYNTWSAMIQRCTNPKAVGFKNYGGRGITVCERWKCSFTKFLADMGMRPNGKTIERVDNSGNYEPSNCKWVTRKEQAINKRNNRIISIAGFTGCLKEAATHFGVPYDRVRQRLDYGWTVQNAFFIR